MWKGKYAVSLPTVMKHIPARFFDDVAITLIQSGILEREIRDFAPEIGYDPEAPLHEIRRPVAKAIADSRERSIARAAREREDVTYDRDADRLYDRFRAC
jgi:hypothetical protein